MKYSFSLTHVIFFIVKTPVPSAPPAPSAQGEVSLPLILWVDDKPENNKIERKAAEDRGINIILVESTAAAKDWIAEYVVSFFLYRTLLR